VTGLQMVVDDLKNNPGRKARSVVVMSQHLPVDGLTYEKAKADFFYEAFYLTPMQQLSEMGVPWVLASGNDAVELGNPIQNGLPQVFQDDDNPLIIVGAAEYDGKRAAFSQLGRLSTLYAPGVGVDCQMKADKTHQLRDGTSYGRF
jgi:hypothetical protein